MGEEMLKKVAVALAALNDLEPMFKELDKKLYRQMCSASPEGPYHVVSHFSTHIRDIKGACANAATQLEDLKALSRALGQLHHSFVTHLCTP